MIIQERAPRFVYQLQIHPNGPKALALAKAVLLSLGFKEEELIVTESKLKAGFEIFSEEQAKLNAVRKLFIRLRLPSIKVTQRRLLPRDWLIKWKGQWKPAALTRAMDVVPVWCKARYKRCRGRDFILMDTLLSFGTGLHETTRFMAQFIEDRQGSFKSFLDIGTGTGILALMALKCGAEDVTAIDIGELSVKAAEDNMKANRLYFDVALADLRTYRLKKNFDFVAANLVTEDLIANGRKITGFVKEGGLLAVSGISLENLVRLRKAFAALPLKCLKVSKGRQWSGILFQKTRS